MAETSDNSNEFSDESVAKLISEVQEPALQARIRALVDTLKRRYDAAEHLARATDRFSKIYKLVDKRAPPGDGVTRVLDYLQTPPTYMFLGLILIALSYVGTITSLNSSLNFIVVILGIAILLYGTGSQAAATLGVDAKQASALLQAYIAASPGQRSDQLLGQVKDSLEKPAANGGLNIAIAGGAAVLAAVFGYGIITFRQDILLTLREWDRYSVVSVDLCYQEELSQKCLGASEIGQASADLDSAIRNQLVLKSGTGRTVFRRIVDGRLEFVVFDGDLGKDRSVEFDPVSQEVGSGRSGASYVVGAHYEFAVPADINLVEDGKCIDYVDAEQKNCAVTYLNDEKHEQGGVPFYDVQAHVYVLKDKVRVISGDDA
ncbi:MAG: hypothetical protein HY834_02285 [Devosia nanyangense]|uniref:Uncharacterized protein n=1 Tax=Devosia nanyangense TaxID=1228055 RepID=A0A933KZ79_9HYPH|nr:hypothetical protein [Devosia nanyangense]